MRATTPEPTTADRLAHARLGDVVELPDGTAHTVRARAVFPQAVGSARGFVLCGELEVMLALPSGDGWPVGLYAAVAEMPEAVRVGVEVLQGACSYWAPHLPGARQGMGELTYRVAEAAGSHHPAVVLYRNDEPVVFTHATGVDAAGIGLVAMGRNEREYQHVRRETSVVVPVGAPVVAPQEVAAPRPAMG